MELRKRRNLLDEFKKSKDFQQLKISAKDIAKNSGSNYIIDHARPLNGLSGTPEMPRTNGFCGYDSDLVDGCFPGVQRLNMMLPLFKKEQLAKINSYFPKKNSEGDTERFGRSAMAEFLADHKNFYGKSRESVVYDKPQNLKPYERLVVGSFTMWTGDMFNAGLKQGNLVTIHNGSIARSRNYEDIYPLSIVEPGRFTKYPASGAVKGANMEGQESQKQKSAIYVAKDYPDYAISVARGYEDAGLTYYFWTVQFPYIVVNETLEKAAGGGGTGTDTGTGEDPCPCRDVTVNKTLYLRKTKATESDIPLDVATTRKRCTGTGGQKRVRFNCEEELAKILSNAGK